MKLRLNSTEISADDYNRRQKAERAGQEMMSCLQSMTGCTTGGMGMNHQGMGMQPGMGMNPNMPQNMNRQGGMSAAAVGMGAVGAGFVGKAGDEGAWICQSCGATNTGRFCESCGSSRK